MTDESQAVSQAAQQAVGRIERDARLARRFVYAIAVLAFAFIVLTGVVTVATSFQVRDMVQQRIDDEKEETESGRFGMDVIRCILGELAEHRIVSRPLHDDFNERTGTDVNAAPTRIHDAEKLIQVCDRVVERLTNGG